MSTDDPAAAGASREVSAPPPDSPHWMRRAPSRPEVRLDAGITAGLFCCAVLSLVFYRALGIFEDPAGPVISVLCLAAVVVPLAWRRRFPATTATIISAAFILLAELQVPEQLIINVALFLAVYSLGAWGGPRRGVRIVRWIIIAAMAAWLLSAFVRISLDPGLEADEALAPGAMTPALAYILYQLLVNILYFSAAIWFGHQAWESARDRARLEERAEQLSAEQATVAEQAAALERMRIARELHDSVAHHVSLMGVQASAARTVLHTDAQTAEKSIRLVEDSARSAVVELHSLLGVLREQPAADDDAERSSAADGRESARPPAEPGSTSSLGAEQISELVTQAGRHGLQVSFQQFGEPQPLRPLVSLNLYRISQEALTNVRKHAGPGAQAEVLLRHRSGSVELEVTDDGAGRRVADTRPSRTPGGHGLVGMRERADAMGGTLLAEPRPEGGFTVRAEVPLAPSSAAGPLRTGTGGAAR